ncbi:3-oxoacyl-ACP reductase (plasmid) [Antarctobacter heliothermus]|uniref:3-oxoacyl-ACP reductase n=1 Tax=Antarctobacter heliothermus TaxID=74033 RepID=A0A222EBK1_9RHOB|nr:SDR family NAD(P)-dependent oxidoreductase [Antarctobacter heliothermus]ASP23490.1 3-oxoacyl-ACP reductase [Antarctobacter heliothermus]
MRFKEKTAVITGGARSIGRACAERFAEEGANVAILDVLTDRGEDTAREIAETHGVICRLYTCDVGTKAEVDATLDRVITDFGGIDVLFSNAGITRRADFLELTEEDFDDVIRINLKSIYLVGQKVARHMVETGRTGTIINMSSSSVRMTMPTIASYAASKGGISALTNAMALSLAKHGIRVNAVGPGTIQTELNRDNLLKDVEKRKEILSRIPLMRFGAGRDVANVVAFLASEDAGYMTGETVYIDGGRSGLNYTLPVQERY